MANLLYNYKNGNCNVSIYDDGTKIREFPDNEHPYADLPESMDVKVTNKCNGVPDKNGNWIPCPFCHEKSLPNGEEGTFEEYKQLFSQLIPGTEIAIGGGCPITWKYIDDFLNYLKDINLIANMTNNAAHIKKYYQRCIDWLNNKLIMAMGISYTGPNDIELIKQLFDKYPDRIVIHMILGVHSIKDYELICNSINNPKILLLGYKTFGRGKNYHVDYSDWKDVKELFNKNNGVLSFDNLAIEQLNIKSYLTEEQWNEFYMGNDGQFSMYMDIVKGEFARSSTSDIRYKLSDYNNIKEIFNKIK